MASREKRPLAPSKTKQKANESNSNSPTSNNNNNSTVENNTLNVSGAAKKNLADNQSTPKAETVLPRKRVVSKLAIKRKQKAKTSLIKGITKLPIKPPLKRLPVSKRRILGKKSKAAAKTQIKTEPVDDNLDLLQELKATKRTKSSPKTSESPEPNSPEKISPKLGRRLSETLSRTVKNKAINQKKVESKAKRSLVKEPEEISVKQEPIDTSYDTTIDEVIASSMLIDDSLSSTEQVAKEFAAGKLVENPFCAKNTILANKRGLRSNGKFRQSLSKEEIEKNLEVMSEDSSEPHQQPQPQLEVDDARTTTTLVVKNSESKDSGPPDGLKIVNIQHLSEAKQVILVSTPANSPVATMSNSLAATSTPSSSSSGSYRRKSRTESPLNSSQINDIISQIKTSIAKTIEDKVYQEKSYILGGKAFELPKKEESFRPDEDKSKSRGYYRVVGSIKSPVSLTIQEPSGSVGVNDAEPPTPAAPPPKPTTTSSGARDEPEAAATPRVADTAKEIEKLVMGKSDAAGESNVASCSPQLASSAQQQQHHQQNQQHSVNDKSGSEASADKAAVDAATADKIEEAGTDANPKPVEEPKKSSPPGPIRRSTRVTAGLSSSALEARRSRSLSDSTGCHNSSSEDDKPHFKEVTVEVHATNAEADEIVTPVAEEDPKPASPQPTDTVEKAEPAKVPEEPAPQVADAEETLESLCDEIERRVEQDNCDRSKRLELNGESDCPSDAEMRLVIDETPDVTAETAEAQTEQKSGALAVVNDDCDVKADGSFEDKSTAKAKTEATEDKVKKGAKRPLKGKGDRKRADSAAKTSPPKPEDKSDAKPKIEELAAEAKVEQEPLRLPDVSVEVTAEPLDQSDTSQKTRSVSEQYECSETAATATIKIEPEEPVAVAMQQQQQPQIRTRRAKGQHPIVHQSLIFKRKRAPKKAQNSKKIEVESKEETTALDNEVAEINEKNLSSPAYVKPEPENLRGLSANAASDQFNNKPAESSNRSKSENDVRSGELSNNEPKNDTAQPVPDRSQQPETVENSDESSTSGESNNSAIFETPEDRAKKEDILRLLGLESREKAKERLEKKREQQSSGTLKTVIRLKDKDGKKRSRSPIKMVLKQQGKTDGEEPIDIYTIQKEYGSSGLGDSTSGANRKLSTNPRHSCDEDVEDPATKGRQSLVIPEKSSSFSIHPGRLCRDNCCYCHGKFGSLDTPMHLAQMKSNERRNKILVNETHLTKDSCLCDACYRHVDRKANMSPTNIISKPLRHSRQSIMGCIVRNCKEPSRHHIKRRWLLKIKDKLRKQVDVNWESPVQNLMTFCSTHYGELERFLVCTLCLRRLSRPTTSPLGLDQNACDELNRRLRLQGIPADVIHNTFICRLCKYYIKVFQKYSESENNLSENNKAFFKNYTKKLKTDHNVEVTESEEEQEDLIENSKIKDKSGPPSQDNGKKFQKLPSSKSDNESHSASTSDKSTPEPTKVDKEPSHSRCMGIEGAIEKLKKRKAIDTSSAPSNGSARDMVEILTMDKDVTLTRIAKKPKLMNNNNKNSSSNGNITNDIFQRLENNRSISVRVLLSGEEDINLQGSIDFNNVREVTPQGWEKCATMIQYDRDTKSLWNELQRPYGSQSSFLRHLIILEKYYRTGDLILAPTASRNAINYSTSVQNRLISYEGPEKLEELAGRMTPELIKLPPLSSGGCLIEQNVYNAAPVSTAPINIAPVNAVRTSASNANSAPVSVAFGTSGSVSVSVKNNIGPSTSMTSSSAPVKPPPPSTYANVTAQLSKLDGPQQVMKLTPGVSIIKKPPPNLQRLNPNHSVSSANGEAKKVSKPKQSSTQGGKVFQLTEPELKRLQSLKKQKMLQERQITPNSHSAGAGGNTNATNSLKAAAALSEYQSKVAMSQFQKHLRMQQEMLNQRRRGDFEPLICDMRASVNENTPTQNLILNNLNLPKSIQVTTKTVAPVATSTPLSILPKIPKNLTIIPQTVTRNQEK